MQITEHEAALIEHAAGQLQQTLLRCNPFPINTPDLIANTIAKEVRISSQDLANILSSQFQKIHQENLEFQLKIAKANEIANATRHRQAIIWSVVTSTLASTLLTTAIQLFS